MTCYMVIFNFVQSKRENRDDFLCSLKKNAFDFGAPLPRYGDVQKKVSAIMVA